MLREIPLFRIIFEIPDDTSTNTLMYDFYTPKLPILVPISPSIETANENESHTPQVKPLWKWQFAPGFYARKNIKAKIGDKMFELNYFQLYEDPEFPSLTFDKIKGFLIQTLSVEPLLLSPSQEFIEGYLKEKALKELETKFEIVPPKEGYTKQDVVGQNVYNKDEELDRDEIELYDEEGDEDEGDSLDDFND